LIDFRIRPHQRPFFSTWTGIDKAGVKVPQKDRLIEIAHRRWGKDEIALRATLIKSQQRPASYWHLLPEYAQGRKALWTAVNPHTGKRRIDEAFPPECIESRDEQAMFLRFKWGSTWQIVGSDRFDSLVGAGVAGVVFSEWALANPSSWGYIRPMVEENNGWAAFITTPRGNNHAKAMYDMARTNPKWFAEVSDVNATGALTAEEQAEALAEYQAIYGIEFGRAMFEQEYLCSFSGAMIGAYWGAEVNKAEREGRIKEVEIDFAHPVHTAWDLGKATNNPIWCFQVIAGQPRIVDFYQPESDDLADWVKWLDDRGYHGTDYVPHDIIVTEWGSKRTRLETLQSLGRKPKRLPMVSVADGLQAGRVTINAAVFADTPRVMAGIEGLKNYRRDWDDERKTFREIPVKDWAEHIGSAFRYLSLAWKDVAPPKPKEIKPTELQYEVRADGRVVGNMDVRAAVEAMMRRKKGKR
jgi:phage terminase large subunit